MSITFTSWTACDDSTNPALDWTDEGAVRGRVPLRYYEALRQALNERLGVASNAAAAAPISDELTR